MDEEMKRRCEAVTEAGEPCRAWAVREGPAVDGRWLCQAHAQRALARAADEVAAALRGRAQGAVVPAETWAGACGKRELYGVFFEAEEVAALEAAVAALQGASLAASLTAEVEVARVILRRLLAEMQATQDPATLAPLALEAARTVARLLRDMQAQGTAGGDDNAKKVIGGALDILGDEWGVDL